MKAIPLNKIGKHELKIAMEELLVHTLKFQDVLENVKNLHEKDDATLEVVKDTIAIMEGKTDLVELYRKKHKKRPGMGKSFHRYL